MVFIDYTPLYYRSIAKTETPSVVSGKFVQLRQGSELYIIFSPKEFTKYHANIVERFCMDKGIEGSYNAKRDRFTIIDTGWQILGGGKFEMNSTQKFVRLYDDSMAYGKFKPDGLKEMLAGLPEFAGFSIEIRLD